MYEKAKQEEENLKLQDNPLNDTKYLDLDDKEFDDEVRELLEWSDNLDFDKYFDEWQKISTSDKTENYSNSLKLNLATTAATISGFEENKSAMSDTKIEKELAKIP
eukprot:CAMPEP_0176460080 /NCGR_PEP_ID=MMETSP0127-20121128/33730_1 /TAXON_ID=938130 /ORGANISM="Platyophrya macrostoma, Strain WH" /LENGTH=105 /DNA_ID=CAMNT_0017851281 /DNA_START=553 /DNA_END=867 /DNA_ORIENTATION=+